MSRVTIVLSETHCKRTTAEQKAAIKKYIEAVINRGSHTTAQLKELNLPKDWNDKTREFTIKVNDVKTKDCLIYVTGVLSGKELDNEMTGNKFLNSFKKSTNLNKIRPVPTIVSHINFSVMGLKMETSAFTYKSWNWPTKAK